VALRLRVKRQFGYMQAKYVMRVKMPKTLEIGTGKGGH